MNRPSKRAEDLADEMIDHVRHGLVRADAVRELAEMIDESNDELVHAIESVISDLEQHPDAVSPVMLARLKAVVHDYEPLRVATDKQADLFSTASRLTHMV